MLPVLIFEGKARASVAFLVIVPLHFQLVTKQAQLSLWCLLTQKFEHQYSLKIFFALFFCD